MALLQEIPLQSLLFFDIETAPITYRYKDLAEKEQELWQQRTDYFKPSDVSADDYFNQKASVYAEFAQVVCISVGYMRGDIPTQAAKLHLHSYYNTSEAEIINQFFTMLRTYHRRSFNMLCGHGIRSFDIPFLARRAVILGIELPEILLPNSWKPWETPYIDTQQVWRFGDNRNYTSLSLLTHVLGINNPKSKMSGNQVASAFHEQAAYSKIAKYCQADVTATAQIARRFKNYPQLIPDNILETNT